MSKPEIIPFAEGDACLDWLALTDALKAGHLLPKADVADSFLYRGKDTLLNRAAWIDGLGLAVKSATIFPNNVEQPSINGGVSLYSDTDGTLEAILDFHLVTKWKTAGDSLLGARLLARPDSKIILIMGTGTVARSLRQAYGSLFPDARFLIWGRRFAQAQALGAAIGAEPIEQLADAVPMADIVTSATMTTDPILDGSWLRPGQHIDLIGAYRPDMREADDKCLQRARLFVDSYDTTLGHIGELKDPLARGVISETDVCADFYTMDAFQRSPEDITLFKNGGGAHLDLMTSRHILDQWRRA